MRDYDPTTGRYIQSDPLGLVDGPSVYGYARQNPGRYVDPRGEFGLAGALTGGSVNAGLQFLKNYAKNGDLGLSLRCIDLAQVAASAAFGAIGAAPLKIAMDKKGGLGKAAGVSALATYSKLGLPVIRLSDDCECSGVDEGFGRVIDALQL